MKAIVVYFSLDGNTRFIAETISYELFFDKFELHLVQGMPTGKWKKILWGGKQVLCKEKPALKHFHLNLDDYTHIFIGTPVCI